MISFRTVILYFSLIYYVYDISLGLVRGHLSHVRVLGVDLGRDKQSVWRYLKNA